jgi:ribosomal protein L40E
MSFLDQIGKKISDVGQGVAQSTKNFADVTKLNGMISDEEKKIAVLYGNIGKAYYSRHREDPGAEELDSINAVNEAFQNIEQYREQIKQIKGTKVCENCGAELASGASFCTNCGAQVAQPQAAPSSDGSGVCPSCGKPVAPGSKFCTNCGAKI